MLIHQLDLLFIRFYPPLGPEGAASSPKIDLL
jgi:hypothetical protein